MSHKQSSIINQNGSEPVTDHDGRPNGYQARCRRCNLTAWVDDSGMMYNLLAAVCPGEEK